MELFPSACLDDFGKVSGNRLKSIAFTAGHIDDVAGVKGDLEFVASFDIHRVFQSNGRRSTYVRCSSR